MSDLDEYINTKYGVSKTDFPECSDPDYARSFEPIALKELVKSVRDQELAEGIQAAPYLDTLKQIKANGIASGAWTEDQVMDLLTAIPKRTDYKAILENRLIIKKRFEDKQYGLISVKDTVGANNPALLNRGTCMLIKSAIADLSGYPPITEELWIFTTQKFIEIAKERNVKIPNQMDRDQ